MDSKEFWDKWSERIEEQKARQDAMTDEEFYDWYERGSPDFNRKKKNNPHPA